MSSAVLCSAACGEGSATPAAAEGDAGEFADLQDDFKGCAEDVPRFEPGLRAAGEHLTVTVIDAMPEEPERYGNDWTVELRETDGSPAPLAEIVRGQTFMPIHGHDGRVEPEMTALSEPGQFAVDRIHFSMRGPWEVRFWLRSESVEEDYAVFHVCVAK